MGAIGLGELKVPASKESRGEGDDSEVRITKDDGPVGTGRGCEREDGADDVGVLMVGNACTPAGAV